MSLPNISQKSVKLNVFLGGLWVDLGTAVLEVNADGEHVGLIDYIPSKPLQEQKEEHAIHDHLDAARAVTDGAPESDA